MKRWAICDKVSLNLAQSGLAPGWAYRTDAQHFARSSRWMEAWGKDWKEATVRCTILEGVVKEMHQAVKSEVKEESGTKLSTKQYRELVKRVYEIRKPEKLQDLGKLLEKYAGRESELFRQVCEKYDVDPDELAAELPQLKASEYAVLVQAAYEQFNPKKLQDMPALLRKYKGRERDLYLQVCQKYGTNPAQFHARHAGGQTGKLEEADTMGGLMAEPV